MAYLIIGDRDSALRQYQALINFDKALANELFERMYQ
jgi:hypothetical protein